MELLFYFNSRSFDLARSQECKEKQNEFSANFGKKKNMGNNKCIVCTNAGPRGYFTFPKKNPVLLEKWLESLSIDKVPKPSATVCFRHFKSDEVHFTDNSTYPAKGKKA